MQPVQRCLCLFTCLLISLQAKPAVASLASFVAAPDASYHWDVGPSWLEGDVTFTSLRLVSQTFQGTPWQHVLTVARPSRLISADHALLIVGGGRHDQLPPFGTAHGQTPAHRLEILRRLASSSRLTVATIEQVPYQPLFGGELEDGIIAHSITQFFQTGDANWPVLQPMVKSVVRAMDALQAHSDKAWMHKLLTFTVSGESKRGWTTWLTAAVDPRVKALAPMVFDMLDIPAQLSHQIRVWGGYSEELGDYRGIAQLLPTPRGQELLDLIDPYRYRADLTQPKLLILGTNDRYWPVDAANHYAAALPGQTYRLYVPNSGHETEGRPGVDDDRVALALAAAGRLDLPKVVSALSIDPSSGDGVLRLHSSLMPQRVRLMKAEAEALDFRASVWSEAQLLPAAAIQEVPLKAQAHKTLAAYIEATYSLGGHRFIVCSEVAIIAKRKASQPG